MTRVTAEFGISGPVEFLDVNVERDNLLFIDPSAIRKAALLGDGYAIDANRMLTSYFDVVLRLLLSTTPSDHTKGEEILQHFGELGATRLGMSKRGYQGHGAAQELGTQIWNELRANPLCMHAIATLKYIEDVPLFVDGIDKDVTSDLTARIILDTLGQFTTDMVRKYPAFTASRPTSDFQTEHWNPAKEVWEPVTLSLPTADGKHLLLVPKRIVNYKIEMTNGQYYQVPLLGYVKSEQMVEVRRGKQLVLRPRFSKKELKENPAFAPSREHSIIQTVRIFEKDGTDVLGGYRSTQQTAFEALSDEQIDDYLNRLP
jgi:hypothetical protein